MTHFFRQFIHQSIIVSIILFSGLSDLTAEQKQLPVLLTANKGKAQIIRSGKTLASSKRMLLSIKDVIRVIQGFVTIQIGYDSIFRVDANAQLSIEQAVNISGEENLKIFLKDGIIYNKIKKSTFKKRPKVLIRTITTVAAVRGTEFMVAAAKNGDTQVTVGEGKVNVAGVKVKKDVDCEAGYGAQVTGESLEKSVLTAAQKEQLRILDDFNATKKVIFDALIEQQRKNQEMMEKLKK